VEEVKKARDQLQKEKTDLGEDKEFLETKVRELQSQLAAAKKVTEDPAAMKAIKTELNEIRKAKQALKTDNAKLEAQVKDLEAKVLSVPKASAASTASPASSSTAFALPPPTPSTPPPPKAITAQDKEIERLRQVIAKNPKDIKSMIKMAEAAFEASRHQDAIDPLKKAVKLQPKDAELFFHAGRSTLQGPALS